MIQPQIDFCCFRLVAINIALTHCYKLVSFLNLISKYILLSFPFLSFPFLPFLFLFTPTRYVPNVAKEE